MHHNHSLVSALSVCPSLQFLNTSWPKISRHAISKIVPISWHAMYFFLKSGLIVAWQKIWSHLYARLCNTCYIQNIAPWNELIHKTGQVSHIPDVQKASIQPTRSGGLSCKGQWLLMTCRGGALANSAVSTELTLISGNLHFLHNADIIPMIRISYKSDLPYNQHISPLYAALIIRISACF
jgi:hypothetical protein